MSPEIELLDQLLGSDEPLYLALLVFGWPAPQALEHAQHAVWMMVQDGVLGIKHRTATGERVLADWEIRTVLQIKSNRLLQGEQAIYYLSLTEEGVQYIG